MFFVTSVLCSRGHIFATGAAGGISGSPLPTAVLLPRLGPGTGGGKGGALLLPSDGDKQEEEEGLEEAGIEKEEDVGADDELEKEWS